MERSGSAGCAARQGFLEMVPLKSAGTFFIIAAGGSTGGYCKALER